MKKESKLLLFLAIIFFVSFSFWQIRIKESERKIQGAKTVQKVSAILKIGDVEAKAFDVSNFIGKTALEATESTVEVVTNGTGENAFVTSIDGREADAKKREFWEFLINGSQSQVGAGSYIVQNNDQIQWKITNF
jgi:hypothetical protein